MHVLHPHEGNEKLWKDSFKDLAQMKVSTKNGTFIIAERDGILEVRAENHGLIITPVASNKIKITETEM